MAPVGFADNAYIERKGYDAGAHPLRALVAFSGTVTVVMEDTEMHDVAHHNDRSQYELVLKEKVKELLLERHDRNGELFSQFFANPDFQQMLRGYLAGTYDEFRGRVG